MSVRTALAAISRRVQRRGGRRARNRRAPAAIGLTSLVMFALLATSAQADLIDWIGDLIKEVPSVNVGYESFKHKGADGSIDEVTHCGVWTDSAGMEAPGGKTHEHLINVHEVGTSCTRRVGEETTACSSPGAKEGEIRTGTLEGTLAFVAKSKGVVGLELKSANPEVPYMEYECGSAKLKFRGALIGTITPLNTPITGAGHFTVMYKQKSGRQAVTHFEGEAAQPLESSLNGGAYGAVGVAGEDQISSPEGPLSIRAESGATEGPAYWAPNKKTKVLEPLTLKQKDPFNTKSGETILGGPIVVYCHDPDEGKGDVEGPFAIVKFKLTLAGCEAPAIPATCQSSPSKPGSVTTEALTGRLVQASETPGGPLVVATRFTPEKGTVVAKIACGPKSEFAGNLSGALLAAMRPVDGEASTTGEFVSEEKASEVAFGCGKQQLLYEDGLGECRHLSTGAGTAWLTGTEVMTYKTPLLIKG